MISLEYRIHSKAFNIAETVTKEKYVAQSRVSAHLPLCHDLLWFALGAI